MTREEILEKAVADLSAELGAMHGTLCDLILSLRLIKHSTRTSALLTSAEVELKASQKRFFAKSADLVGGARAAK